MLKKIFFRLCLGAVAISLNACSQGGVWSDKDDETAKASLGMYNGQYMSLEESETFVNNPVEAAKIFNKRVPPLNSVIVCRSKQCAPADLSMSREYIYNSFAHLIDNNLDTTALLCEANPQAHTCINPYLSVPAKIGVTPAYVFFDGVKLVDASSEKGKTALNLVLGYNLSYNGQTPTVCKPDTAVLYVKSNSDIVLNGNGFKCDMTSIGTTTVKVMFNIDYIDLDYGYIGGYYSIGLSGPASGGGSGYGMIRLVKDAYPLSPSLMSYEDERDDVLARGMSTPVKPDVNVKALQTESEAQSSSPEKVEEKAQQTEKVQVAPVDIREPLREKEMTSPAEFKNQEKVGSVNASQPVRITPDTVVTSDKVILKPAVSGENAYEVPAGDFGPEFNEIYIDDLEEYIK